ncbi:hypothetical protein HDV04_003285 [Boothiomyces sp. JEL0838]|nr:hypothetical protein HDV04_003263 [Boothiomyces sp. JEL0838]KAJ3312264.1 hypothetical protein HDV04_003285 [Boothiomyces sp. JEL0838]
MVAKNVTIPPSNQTVIPPQNQTVPVNQTAIPQPPTESGLPFNATWACFSAPNTDGQPISKDLSLTCPVGFFCPNTTASDPASFPRICPPSVECSILRLAGDECAPQGPLEPTVCPHGYYCPDQNTKLVCPEHHFCPTGTVQPISCGALSICKEGSRTQFAFDGVMTVGIIDLLLVAFYYLVTWRKKVTSREKKPLLEKKVTAAPVETVVGEKLVADKEEALSEVTSEGTPEKEVLSDVTTQAVEKEVAVDIPVAEDMDSLVQAFHKGLNGREIAMDFKFENMGLTLPSGKTILQGVSGSIKSSRMTAIMGPSGAGKTTFMNVLCGKVSRTDGKLYVSGKEAEIHEFKKMIGYVPQEDVMIRQLTVRDVLTHSARIRLPRSWTEEDIRSYVDALLVALNLAHVQDTIIGDEVRRGVSGGQRKRVNIGIELAAVPVCIFLDEPTSGLDSTSALEVCEILRKITRLGLTTVAVIHQPRVEIYEKFDDILMIAPGGRTAYLGPVTSVQPYFENLGYVFDPRANPADVLMDILSGKGINPVKVHTSVELANLWAAEAKDVKEVEEKGMQENSSFHEEVPKLIKERGASFIKQLIFCHYRGLLQQIAVPQSFVLEAGLSVLAGVAMGISLTSNPNMYTGMYLPPLTPISPGPLEWVLPLMGFLIATAAALAAGPAAVKVFSEEKPVFWREASAGHSTLGYYIGKTLSSFYRLAICSLHFTVPLHLISKPLIGFWQFYLIILATYFGIYGLSAVVSFFVEREDASLMAVVICLFHGITAGFGISILDARKAHIGWLFDMSYNRWITEAMYNEGVKLFSTIYDTEGSADLWGYTLDRFTYDILLAILIGFVWRIAGYAAMMLTNRDKRR